MKMHALVECQTKTVQKAHRASFRQHPLFVYRPQRVMDTPEKPLRLASHQSVSKRKGDQACEYGAYAGKTRPMESMAWSERRRQASFPGGFTARIEAVVAPLNQAHGESAWPV